MTDAPTPAAATGTQFQLHRAGATATITALAAGLRCYTRDGVQLVESYGVGEIAPGGSGITLAPFANRVDGGRWLLDGVPQQLDITEVPRNNAIHGLLRNTGYTVLSQVDDAVELAATIHPQHGYPFLTRHRVRYELTAVGALRVKQTLENLGDRPAPVVLGAHPYLRLGDVAPEELTLRVGADTFLSATDRMIPTGSGPVDAAHDLRTGRLLGQALMDTAYTALHATPGHSLTAPDGRSVTLWHDDSVRYLHVYVTPTFPGRSLAVALEPMTGPANAFNSGDGLLWVAPGESVSMRWGIDAQLS